MGGGVDFDLITYVRRLLSVQLYTAVQDQEEWRKRAGQGAECFMAKLIAAMKARAGLREDRPKQAGLCWFRSP